VRHALKEFMVDDADGGVGRKARSQVSGLGAFATSSDFKELCLSYSSLTGQNIHRTPTKTLVSFQSSHL
jgi:hypothetical protein